MQFAIGAAGARAGLSREAAAGGRRIVHAVGRNGRRRSGLLADAVAVAGLSARAGWVLADAVAVAGLSTGAGWVLADAVAVAGLSAGAGWVLADAVAVAGLSTGARWVLADTVLIARLPLGARRLTLIVIDAVALAVVLLARALLRLVRDAGAFALVGPGGALAFAAGVPGLIGDGAWLRIFDAHTVRIAGLAFGAWRFGLDAVAGGVAFLAFGAWGFGGNAVALVVLHLALGARRRAGGRTRRARRNRGPVVAPLGLGSGGRWWAHLTVGNRGAVRADLRRGDRYARSVGCGFVLLAGWTGGREVRIDREEVDLLDAPAVAFLLGDDTVDVERRLVEHASVGCLHRLRHHDRTLHGVVGVLRVLGGNQLRDGGHLRLLRLPLLPPHAVAALDLVLRALL